MHPIFAQSNIARSRAIRENLPLSICLHEAGHVCVARALGVCPDRFELPDLRAVKIGGGGLPSVVVDRAGLSDEAVMSILLGGYAGELCLYDRDYIAGGGEYYTCILNTADDATRLANMLPLPVDPTTHGKIEVVLVAALQSLRHRPYTLLTRDLTGFRCSVSRIHAAWEATGFRSFAVPEHMLAVLH